MKYAEFLREVNQKLRQSIGRCLDAKQEKLAKKIYNQRHTVDDAVGMLIIKI